MLRLLKALGLILFLFVALSLLWVAVYAVVDPPGTIRMAQVADADIPIKRRWRALDEIDVNLPRAAIAGEDARFCSHSGFDLEGIRNAMENNLEGGKLKGGSTISQQTAKNVFLWPQRSWLRKGLEAWFTLLIEQLWGKRRIMEVYLNVAEFGIGVFGADAAARHYFDHGAEKLSRREAARLIAVLPSPIKRDARNPRGYTKRYARNIERWIRVVRDEGTDRCLAL